jgi:uncharacterized protein with NRDE domain
MCTLMVAIAAAPGVDLAVSANRNEFLQRPAQAIHRWPEIIGVPTIVAPIDLQAGGTWQGLNDRGLFACITNRHGANLDASRTSRGALVAAALACKSLGEARAFFSSVHAAEYNGFHLLVSDRHEALLLIGDGVTARVLPLGPGVHVITERSFGAGQGSREQLAHQAFVALFSSGMVDLERLRIPMTAHSDESIPLEAACVHADAFGYGTRSSLQLIVPTDGEAMALFTEGHPCVNAARDVSEIVAPMFSKPKQ